MDQLLTVEEAARSLACTPAAIRKWIYQKRLPYVKVGRLTRLRQDDIERIVSKGPALRRAAGPLRPSWKP